MVKFSAQLFAETTFSILTSKVISPLLAGVFSLLKGHSMGTLNVNSASHTLTLPLLRLILMSHDTKIVSYDFKETGMQVLSVAVDRHLAGLDKVRSFLSLA